MLKTTPADLPSPSPRAFNFSSGPAMLPTEALLQAQAELLSYAGTGVSILEHSHRGAEYEAVHQETLALVRELLAVPSSHDVLLLQGGATQQFAQVPMNFLHPGQIGNYVVYGTWGDKALEEARGVGQVHIAATTGEDGTYRRAPQSDEIEYSDRPAYVHITSNETILGIQWHALPDFGGRPVIADMSSDILARPLDVSRYAMIYAGAQKNLGPSGLVLVIAARDFLATGRTDIPKFFRYTTHQKAGSILNTPPTFSVYLMRNVLRWVRQQGGLVEMTARAERKAAMLYTTLEELADVYALPIERASRSKMNVVFRLATREAEAAFLAGAEARSLVGLAGHRTAGGMRASIYNAMPEAGVARLCEWVREFGLAERARAGR